MPRSRPTRTCSEAIEGDILFELLDQIIKFMKVYRKYWMAPIILGLVLLGGLLVAAQSSVFAPLIYALF